MTIQYHKSGNYYLPNLVLEETEAQPIGKYGRMRKCYLKEHRPVLYSTPYILVFLFSRPMVTRLARGKDRKSVSEVCLLKKVESNNKSEPVSRREDLVRILLVWCARRDLNPHVRNAH